MNTTNKIKILIVDDYELVRKGLAALLRSFPNLEVVATTGDSRIALAFCASFQPDVVVMEMDMAYMNGVITTRLIRRKFPNIQVVILSAFADETLTFEVLGAGATSYLLKTGTINELVAAIRGAYAGKSILAPEVVAALISMSQHRAKPGDDLTFRERDILSRMIDGSTNAVIARQLTISPSTVKNHVSSIFSKLEAKSRTKVVALAVQYKLYLTA